MSSDATGCLRQNWRRYAARPAVGCSYGVTTISHLADSGSPCGCFYFPLNLGTFPQRDESGQPALPAGL